MMPESKLSVQTLKMRYFAYNCMEIKLPDGKTLVIDPCIKKEGRYDCGYDSDILEGCDYVLVNHSHMDHVASLGEVYERFQPTVLAHGATVWDLATYFDIPYIKMVPFTSGDCFDYGCFQVQILPGRHNPGAMFMVKPSEKTDEAIADRLAPKSLGGLAERLNQMGTIFNSNFLITLSNNVRIALFAGNPGMIAPEDANLWKQIRADIVLAHRALTSYENWAERMANVLAVTGARILIPIHIDNKFLEKEDPRHYVGCINEVCEKKGIMGRAIILERAKWYQFSTCVEPEVTKD